MNVSTVLHSLVFKLGSKNRTQHTTRVIYSDSGEISKTFPVATDGMGLGTHLTFLYSRPSLDQCARVSHLLSTLRS